MSRRAKGSGFKMKGSPVKTGKIHGTPMYKASMAKAKEKTIVKQTRTQSDDALTSASIELGYSLSGKPIDYTISTPGITTSGYSGGGEDTPPKPGTSEMPKE